MLSLIYMGAEKLSTTCQELIKTSFSILMVTTPLLITTNTKELFEFPKMLSVYLATVIITTLFLIKAVADKKFRIQRTPLDFPILLFLGSYTLTTILSINRHTSLWGYYGRFNGGLASVVCYIALYYILVTEFSRREAEKLLNWMLLSGVAVSLGGILQHFGMDRGQWVQDSQTRVFSTIGQPNWLATYLVILIPIALYKKAWPFLGAATMYFACFWFTYSLSGLLGLAAALAIFSLWLGKAGWEKNWRSLTITAAVWILIATSQPGLFGPRLKTLWQELQTQIARQTVIHAAGPLTTPSGDTGSIRLIVWEGTLELIKAHPWLGTGPETFAYSFLQYRPVELNYTSEWDFLYNKAHNEYLNLAAGSGLLGLGSYLIFIGSFLVWSWKGRRDPITLLTSGWVGALVAIFFGFSVVPLSLIMWLLPAIVVTMGRNRVGPFLRVGPLKRVRPYVLGATTLIGGYLILNLTNLFLADIAFTRGFKLLRSNLPTQAVPHLEKATQLNKSEPAYWRELAAARTVIATQTTSEEGQQGFIQKAAASAEQAYHLNPHNSLTLKSLLRTYYQLNQLDSRYQTPTQRVTETLIKLSPTEPRVFYDAALIYTQLGNLEAARLANQIALELKADYEKALELQELLIQQEP